MRIEDIRLDNSTGKSRVSARVVWEECERPEQEIYYEVAQSFVESLEPTPQAFLVAAFIPAMRRGERRVAIDGAICPELREGLEVAMGWLHKWHGAARPVLAIEARTQATPPVRPQRDRAACFFTGGVDSMATLRRNRLRFPLAHPYAIQDGVIIYGLEVDRESAFDSVLQSLSVLATDASMTLLPVATNIRTLDDDWTFWEFEWEGAVYASVAHVLCSRLTTASISSTYDIANMNQLGSHPLLDPNYGSATLRIRHDGATMSRLDKLRLIVEWDAGLQHLRVCNAVPDYRLGTINCGRCEKCVRTMLGLAALGALHRTRSFGGDDLNPEVVASRCRIHSPYMDACYAELVAPLAAAGRRDLAEAVRFLLNKHRGELGWRGRLLRFDRRVFGGRLHDARRLLRPGRTRQRDARAQSNVAARNTTPVRASTAPVR